MSRFTRGSIAWCRECGASLARVYNEGKFTAFEPCEQHGSADVLIGLAERIPNSSKNPDGTTDLYAHVPAEAPVAVDEVEFARINERTSTMNEEVKPGRGLIPTNGQMPPSPLHRGLPYHTMKVSEGVESAILVVVSHADPNVNFQVNTTPSERPRYLNFALPSTMDTGDYTIGVKLLPLDGYEEGGIAPATFQVT